MNRFVLGVLVFSVSFSQAQTDAIGDFNKHVIEKWTEDYIRVSQYRVKGSPYLLGESFDGELTMKTGLKTVNQKILYNIMEQKVGTEINKQMIAPDGDVVSFYIQLPEKFGSEKLDFLWAETLGKSNVKGYLNLLSDGPKLAFLRQYKSRLVPDPTNMYSKDIRIFEQYYEYYIYIKKTAELIKVRLKEKDVVAALVGFPVPAEADFSKMASVKQIIELLNR
ncbi:MAG: hypothetical protein RLY85_1269 [Bacteroidota bacterium]|jgi:hypothetical protein